LKCRINVPESEYMAHKNRNKKRAIGAVAAIIIAVLLFLEIFQVLEFFVWLILVLIVGVVANLLLRRLNR